MYTSVLPKKQDTSSWLKLLLCQAVKLSVSDCRKPPNAPCEATLNCWLISRRCATVCPAPRSNLLYPVPSSHTFNLPAWTRQGEPAGGSWRSSDPVLSPGSPEVIRASGEEPGDVLVPLPCGLMQQVSTAPCLTLGSVTAADTGVLPPPVQFTFLPLYFHLSSCLRRTEH